MTKKIIKINPSVKGEKKQHKKKVAVYARVSTDKEEQLNSLKAQKEYFIKYINDRTDWEFSGLYFDEGISGTRTKNRNGFTNMITDALTGKFDLIITKSISRFARNTVDTVQVIRDLKEKGIGVYFQKENIDTLDAKGEFVLTMMASFAQEESRSISENCTWGKRKSFARGNVSLAYSRFFGYDRSVDGNFIINPKEARVIQCIFELAVIGYTAGDIQKYLMDRKVKTVTGRDEWFATCIKKIIANEKYKGDALLQKSFTIDFLTKKRKLNEGELPKYYVENNHEAIIDKTIHTYVSKKLCNTPRKRKYSLTRKIKCGECGSLYHSFRIHPEHKGGSIAWQCKNKYSKDCKCNTRHVYDKKVHECLVGMCIERYNNSSLKEVLKEIIGKNEVTNDTHGKYILSVDVGGIIDEMIVDKNHGCTVKFIDGVTLKGNITGTGRRRG